MNTKVKTSAPASAAKQVAKKTVTPKPTPIPDAAQSQPAPMTVALDLLAVDILIEGLAGLPTGRAGILYTNFTMMREAYVKDEAKKAADLAAQSA